MPTYTAPGHTTVYTGSVPAIHGIVGNDWYQASINKNLYCTEDSTVSTVGGNSALGQMSPANLLVTTIADELRLSNNFKSKVIGVALKDRGAILPAGHSGNAAYWYDDTFGGWISSTYYQQQLPAWVQAENDKQYPAKAMSKDWNLLLPADKYTQSTPDDRKYEGKISGTNGVTFPHKLSEIDKQKFSAFKYTPFASTYTFDMAKAAIKNEKLGAGTYTDMLAVSISSTDYMGHTFGPNSLEAEDTYLRLDRDIADFLKHLDATIGKGNYLVFLSADHAAAHVPGYLNENKIPGGTFSGRLLSDNLKKHLKETTGLDNAIITLQNNQVYLDNAKIKSSGKNIKEVEEEVMNFLKGQPFIEYVYVTAEVQNATIPYPIKQMIINGYNPKRSGHIGYIPKANFFSGGATGTTHGSWNPYDSHIPLVWFGTGIKSGKTNRETYMSDIAPTLAAILQIQMPSGNVGKVITEVTK